MKPWPAVVVLNIGPRQPTYHALGRMKPPGNVRQATWLTKCGLRMGYFDADRYPSLVAEYDHALLRRDHADSFARPCGKCFVGENA